VTGRVYVDQNFNDTHDADEKTLDGVKVWLGDKAVTTDGEGRYLFDELNKGSYLLSVDPASLPEGLVCFEKTTVEMPVEPKSMSGMNIAVIKKAPKTSEAMDYSDETV
jgi:hypothetical protein